MKLALALLLSTVPTAALLSATPSYAEQADRAAGLDTPVVFNIPSQSLDLAVLGFSRQSGVQVISSATALRGKVAPAVNGSRSPRDALSRLLQGSNLTFSALSSNTVTIVEPSALPVRDSGEHRALTPVVFRTAPAAENGQVQAQPAAQSGPALEELIVTARRREETLQSVPAVIQAFDGGELASTGVNKLADISNLVSGLTFAQYGGHQPMIAMRGSANRLGQRPTVGVFQDGFALSPGQMSKDALDVVRVEVVKGPQSALFGRSTVGGAINLITNDPTAIYEGSVEVGGGASTADGERLYHAEAIVSGPLVGEALLGRLVVAKSQRDGFVYDPVNGARGLGYDRLVLRAKLLWLVNDDLRVRFTAEFLEDHPTHGSTAPGPQGVYTVPLLWDTRPGFLNRLSEYDYGKNIWDTRFVRQEISKSIDKSLALQVKWDTALGMFTSNSAYSRTKLDQENDISGAPFLISAFRYANMTNQYSQEFQLTGGNRLTYLGGLYYFRSDYEVRGYGGTIYGPRSQQYNSGTAAAVGPQTEHLKSYSAFGQLGYDFTDQFNITASLRYTRDELNGVVSSYITRVTGETVTQLAPTYREATFKAFQGNISATYKFTPDILVYGSFARGDKPGGLNAGSTVSVATTPFEPENVNAYELGFKGTMIDRRLRTNLALFYNDLRDIQLTRNQILVVGEPSRSITTNAAKGRAKGADADIEFQATENLRFSVGYTYLDALITEFELAPGTPPQQSLAGQPPLRSPKHSGRIGADWQSPLGEGTFTFGGSLFFTSSYANDYVTPPSVGLPVQLTLSHAYQKLDLTAGYAWGPWTVSAYIHNLFNKQYYVAGAGSLYNQQIQGIPGEPRTFEITLRRTF